jgi:hypothetical protein
LCGEFDVAVATGVQMGYPQREVTLSPKLIVGCSVSDVSRPFQEAALATSEDLGMAGWQRSNVPTF